MTIVYPYLTLNDDTEIIHSEMLPDGRVKVYIEKPNAKDGFHHATCYLPKYEWEDIYGFSDEEMIFKKLTINNAHVIIELSNKNRKSEAGTCRQSM